MNETPHSNDMPDPIDFVPGQKLPGAQMSPAPAQIERKKGFPKYVLPMIINIFVFFLLQLWVSLSCNALPIESRGECGAGWINVFLFWPVEAIVFIICLVIMIVGFARQSKT